MPPIRTTRPRIGILLASSACLAGLASSSAAQTAQPYTLELTPPGGGQYYTRTASGDFDGDCNADVAYLLGSTVECMLAPGTFEARMTNLGNVNDFDVMQRPGEDSVVGVNSVGLVEIAMNAHVLPQWPWTTAFRLQGGWAGAIKVRTWSVSESETFFVGLGAGGNSLVSARRSGPNGGSWTPGATIALSPAASPQCEIAAYDRDGDGLPEVALMNPQTLTIYSPWGGSPSSPVESWGPYSGTNNNTIARVRHDGFTREWLAWVYTLSNGTTQRFLTVGLEGARNLQLVGSGGGVFAQAAGDVNGDEMDDLVASWTFDWSLNYVLNSGQPGPESAGPVFVVADFVRRIYSTQSAASNRATPLIVDIDHDGDGELGTPLQHEGRLWFAHENIYPITTRPSLVTFSFQNVQNVGAIGVNSAVAPTMPQYPKGLQFTIAIPPHSSGPWPANHYLALAAWSRNSPSAELNPVAFAFTRIPIAGEDGAETFGFDPEFSSWINSSLGTQPYPDPNSAPGFDQLVYLVAQIVEAPGPVAPPTRVYTSLVVLLHGQDRLNQQGPRPNHAFVVGEIGGDENDGFQVAFSAAPNPLGLGQDIGLAGGVPDMPAEVNNPPR